MYTKQNFIGGQVLKAEHLIKMEEGIIECQIGLEVGKAAGSIQQMGFTMSNGTTTLGAIASGEGAVAFGGQRFDKAGEAVADEPQTEAKGKQSFAAGGGVIVNGDWSAAFGKETKAFMRAGFAIGAACQVGLTQAEYDSATNNYANWRLTQGKNDNESLSKKLDYNAEYSSALAAGEKTGAYGRGSFTHGIGTKAWGYASEAGGKNCIANNWYVYAGGLDTKVSGKGSFAHGIGLQLIEDCTAAFGRYNEGVGGDYLFEVGNGINEYNRRTAFAINGNGDLLFYNYHDNKLYSLSDIINGLGGFFEYAVAKDYN